MGADGRADGACQQLRQSDRLPYNMCSLSARGGSVRARTRVHMYKNHALVTYFPLW